MKKCFKLKVYQDNIEISMFSPVFMSENIKDAVKFFDKVIKGQNNPYITSTKIIESITK